MPFYYNIPGLHTTSATANTETSGLRLLTGAARQASISRLIVGARGAVLDIQTIVRLWRMSPASTGGAAVTPQPRDPGLPAAALVAATGPTIGTRSGQPALVLPLNTRATVQWVALEPAEAVEIVAGGGANGNADLMAEQGAATAVTVAYDLTFFE